MITIWTATIILDLRHSLLSVVLYYSKKWKIIEKTISKYLKLMTGAVYIDI